MNEKTLVGEVTLTYKKKTVNKIAVKNSNDIYCFCKKIWYDDLEICERFLIILLNRANETIGWHWISKGGISGTVVDVRIIAKSAIDCLSSSVICVHNHPSGNLKPSEQDTKITKNIKDVLNLLSISLLDHIIITSESYFSFADEGLIF